MISNHYCTNKGNSINESNNNVSFTDYTESVQFTSKTTKQANTEIDTELCQLSSRKLWQILKLSQVKGCELEQVFLQQVQTELIIRDDFDNGEAWNDPH